MVLFRTFVLNKSICAGEMVILRFMHCLKTQNFPMPLEKKWLKELPCSFSPAFHSCRSLCRGYVATKGLLTISIPSFSPRTAKVHTNPLSIL